MEADPQLPRGREQRLGLVARHLGLEIAVELFRVVDDPAREEGGQRQFGKHHEGGAGVVRPVEHRDQPVDHLRARVRTLDRPHLCRSDGELSGHRLLPSSHERPPLPPRTGAPSCGMIGGARHPAKVPRCLDSFHFPQTPGARTLFISLRSPGARSARLAYAPSGAPARSRRPGRCAARSRLSPTPRRGPATDVGRAPDDADGASRLPLPYNERSGDRDDRQARREGHEGDRATVRWVDRPEGPGRRRRPPP